MGREYAARANPDNIVGRLARDQLVSRDARVVQKFECQRRGVAFVQMVGVKVETERAQALFRSVPNSAGSYKPAVAATRWPANSRRIPLSPSNHDFCVRKPEHRSKRDHLVAHGLGQETAEKDAEYGTARLLPVDRQWQTPPVLIRSTVVATVLASVGCMLE